RRRVVPLRAGRDRSRAVHHHADHQLAVAPPDLEHGPQRELHTGAGRSGGDGVTSTSRRKLLSSLFVAFCASAVILALIPLAFVLFFVISQGILSLNLSFFTHM